MVQTSLMSMSQMSWAASYLLTLSLNSYFEGLHPAITVNRVLFLLLPFAISEICIKKKKTLYVSYIKGELQIPRFR